MENRITPEQRRAYYLSKGLECLALKKYDAAKLHIEAAQKMSQAIAAQVEVRAMIPK